VGGLRFKRGSLAQSIAYVDAIRVAWLDSDTAVAARHAVSGSIEPLDAGQDELASSALLGSASSAAVRRVIGARGSSELARLRVL
jgi:hypothetical protein